MKAHSLGLGLVLSLAACGADPGSPFIAVGPDASVPTTPATPDVEEQDSGVVPEPGGSDAGTDGTAPASIADPEKDGPFEVESRNGKVNGLDVRAFYPKTGGPQPVIVVAHGLNLPASQYESYLERLASFGYVALTVDYEASLAGNDNPVQAKALVSGIDWAKDDAKVGPHTDATNAGMAGHSLGGKLALLAATLDPRVKAVVALDPVDGGGPTGCMAPCVVVADKLSSLSIPTAFIGETLDATSMPPSPQACAPASANFKTFYAKAKSPSLAVTVAGAAHMSFIDDLGACGITCNFCKKATAKAADITTVTKAYVVAFFERHLRGNAAYDPYLTGTIASDRYVKTKRITLESK